MIGRTNTTIRGGTDPRHVCPSHTVTCHQLVLRNKNRKQAADTFNAPTWSWSGRLLGTTRQQQQVVQVGTRLVQTPPAKQARRCLRSGRHTFRGATGRLTLSLIRNTIKAGSQVYLRQTIGLTYGIAHDNGSQYSELDDIAKNRHF